nr:unnamed protein product [Leishmania braziliensis]
MVRPPLSSSPTATSRQLRRRLWWCVCLRGALTQTQLLWRILFNALLTAVRFVFHECHLIFEFGTLFGYMAAVASLFLCGMEMGCIMVRLWRRCPCGRTTQTPGEGIAVDASPYTDDSLLRLAPYGAIQEPPMAYLGEGDASWMSHTSLVQW